MRRTDETRRAPQMVNAQLQRQGARGRVASPEPSVADVALYPFTCTAPMGEAHCAPIPPSGAWLDRLEALPGSEALSPGASKTQLSTQERPVRHL